MSDESCMYCGDTKIYRRISHEDLTQKPIVKSVHLIDNVQQFADKLKGEILDMLDVPKKQRLDGLRAISDLERCGWHPAMMTDAVAAVMGDERDGWAFLEGDNRAVLANIEKVIHRYLSIYGCEGGDVLSEVYDMHEAAAYLGITYDGMKVHVSRRDKHLRGVMKGRTMLFTRAQLDAFKKDHIRGADNTDSSD